jgi:hypothetical protein
MSDRGKIALWSLVGFVVAVIVLGVIALSYGGSVEAEKTASGMSFRVIGVQHVSLKDLLDQAGKEDPDTLRSLLISRGKQYDLVDARSLPDLECALKKGYIDQWPDICKWLQSNAKLRAVDVKISYADPGAIDTKTLNFKGGDTTFQPYLGHACEVEVGQARMKMMIGLGGIVSGEGTVQVPLNDLVDLYARRNGEGFSAETSSKAYAAIKNQVQKLGVIPGRVYVQ